LRHHQPIPGCGNAHLATAPQSPCRPPMTQEPAPGIAARVVGAAAIKGGPRRHDVPASLPTRQAVDLGARACTHRCPHPAGQSRAPATPIAPPPPAPRKGSPMQSPRLSALWGRCRKCTGWFAIQSRGTNAARWQCPICGEEPDWLENRAHPAYCAAAVRPEASAPSGSPPAGQRTDEQVRAIPRGSLPQSGSGFLP
jgi:hypothetical protein